MSKSTKVLLAFCMVAFVAACAKKEAEVGYVAERVSPEPTYPGKYK